MLFKSFTASIVFLALTSSVNADQNGCVVSPALGVSGTPGTGDVQQPSSGAPCGNKPISQNIDASNAVQADANDQFKVTVINFQTGAAGSRNIATVEADPSGDGTSFTGATIVDNGDSSPTNTGPQELTVQLPQGIKCLGGKNKNCCVASFVSTAGYGNCVVVCQSGNNAKRSAPGDKEKPKPSPEPTLPPKSHKFGKGKKMGGRGMN